MSTNLRELATNIHNLTNKELINEYGYINVKIGQESTKPTAKSLVNLRKYREYLDDIIEELEIRKVF